MNTGNMCFANAVLQLLAYCAPFARLFESIGKVLPGAEEGKRKRDVEEGATPLVDATVRFLREFGPVERKRDEEEEEGIDSFLPSYVYDAMKEKKRFASMVVRILGIYVRRISHENILFSGRTPRRC